MRTFLELPQQPSLPSRLDGRHPLFLTDDGRLVDEDGEVLDRPTFIRMREELGARILTNARGKVARALGFSGGGAAGIVRPVHFCQRTLCVYRPSQVRKRLLKDN